MTDRSIFLLVLLFFTSIGTADAASVHLKDGSIVVGSIIGLTDGADLRVDTEHMDEVVIAWDAVELVTDTKVLDVELFDGRRFAGTLSRSGADVEVSGDSPLEIVASDVFEIQEYRESILDGFSAETSLGMNLVRGNNRVTQVSIGAGVGYDDQNFTTQLRATTIVNEQTGAGDTRRSTLTGSYAQKFDKGWQAIGSLQFEADEQQGLDGRTLLAAGIGKRVLNQRKHRLELFTGLALNAERFENVPSVETLEGLLGSTYRMRSFADIDATLLVLPSLEDSDRVRVQFDAVMNFDLYADLDFQITVYDRYDSQPPAGNDKNDTGLTLGLSWSY